MNDLLAKTPNYVLLDGTKRFGPDVLALESGRDCIAVYGFSDKSSYDAFCKNTTVALTPYPLMKGYLKNQIESDEDTLLIMAIDAAGPDEPIVNASTFPVVLEAREKKMTLAAVGCQLLKDNPSTAYRVEECHPAIPV
jgi:hypothetical protein